MKTKPQGDMFNYIYMKSYSGPGLIIDLMMMSKKMVKLQ